MIQERIRRDVALTQELAGWVAGDNRFEIVAPHPLNLLCIRVAGDNALTDTLIENVNRTGTAHVTRTVLNEQSVMRVSIGAQSTERQHVEQLWQLIQACV